MLKHPHKTLTGESEIAAFLHSSRMAILEALKPGPATVSQIGQTLGIHPANLTRHIRILLDAGLIALVEKRDTGRNLEKYYAATAMTFDVAPEADNLQSPSKIALAFARSDLSAALMRLAEDDNRPVTTLLAGVRISKSDVERFSRALINLLESFTAADCSDGERYHLNLSLYPSDVELPSDRRLELRRRRK